MKILKVLAFMILFVLAAVLAGGTYINFALPNTGPAPEIRIIPTAERIERGRYLANHVAACMDCHSARDWTVYSGPMLANTLGEGGELFDEKMKFPGRIYAPNLTPHALSEWTDGEVFKAITTGESRDGRALFPVMAYERFGKMDKEDIISIIAYIRSLVPIVKNVPATQLNFPINLINKTLPKTADFQKRPHPSDTLKYGAYLINAAGCVDCHSRTFGGGMEFEFPSGILRAPNITMHKQNGLGMWTKEAFVKRFKLYSDSNYKAEKVGLTVNNTVMPWTVYSGMQERDLGAIYAYLKSIKPSPNKVVVRTTYK